MTPKSRVVFAHGLNELKKDYVSVVEGLLVDHCQSQRGLDANPRVYLTCTVVLDEEMPWIAKPRLPQLPPRIRITDEDEEDIEDTIEADDGRAVPLLSSSPSNMFLNKRTRAPPPNSSLIGTDAPGRLASMDMHNESSNHASSGARLPGSVADIGGTSRRRRSSAIDSDDGEAHPPAKKAKTSSATPIMPRFPDDGRMTSDRATILSSGIHTGLIVGDELANIHARAEMSAAAGIPNMGGLIPNPTTKPRGGFNQMFTTAITGGCGANARGALSSGIDAEEGSEAADDGIEEISESQHGQDEDGALKPASDAAVSKAALQTQAGIESGPNTSAPSQKNDPAMVAPESGIASGLSSQQTAGISTQNAQISTIHNQTSVTTAPDSDSSPEITQGGRVVSQATTRIKSTSSYAEGTPTPLSRSQQGRRNAAASPISSVTTLDAFAVTIPQSSRPREGNTSQGILQEIACQGMKSLVDSNARLREAVMSHLPRTQDGNLEPVANRNYAANYNYLPPSSQSNRPESRDTTQIGCLPAQPRQMSEFGPSRSTRPSHQSGTPSPQRPSMGGSMNSDPQFMTSMHNPRPRSNGVESASRASFSQQPGSPVPHGTSMGTLRVGDGMYAGNPSLGGSSVHSQGRGPQSSGGEFDPRSSSAIQEASRPASRGGGFPPRESAIQAMSHPRSRAGNSAPRSSTTQRDGAVNPRNSGPSQQNRPRAHDENFFNPRVVSTQGFGSTGTQFQGNRTVRRGENNAPQGPQANPLVPSAFQPVRPVNHGKISAPRGQSSSQLARPSGNAAPSGEKKTEPSTEQVNNTPGFGKDFVPKN